MTNDTMTEAKLQEKRERNAAYMRRVAAARTPEEKAAFLAKRRTSEASQQREVRRANPEKFRALYKSYYWANPEKARGSQREYRAKIRSLVFGHYGTWCVCCGENEPEFLSIDHIAGDGAAKRSEHGSGASFYYWLVSHDFPQGFQVLCYNCNFAKRTYKECPHSKILKSRLTLIGPR
jgi:hypothetical protein